MDIFDIGFWLITWMMLGILGIELVGGWYWNYIAGISAILFMGYMIFLIFFHDKLKNVKSNRS